MDELSVSPIIELGRDIEAAWLACEHDLGRFPGLCVDRMIAARIHEVVRPDDVIRWALSSDLPAQLNARAKFGQPPITVYRGRRFVIDVLFWVDGTTAIHDHAFSGAFSVLSGRSIETTFAFTASKEFDGRFRLGQLGITGTALRKAGDVSPITAGPRFIHSLFHLDRPSVSLVVRTFSDPVSSVQHRYHPSGFAHQDPFEDEMRDRQLEVVELLLQTEHPDLELQIGDLIARADLHTAFAAVRACLRVRDPRVQDRLVKKVRDPAIGSVFRDWLSQEQRLGMLRRARADVVDAELRFLLAVLMNAHRRADAVLLVSAFAPAESPARWIARALRRLSTVAFRLQVRNIALEQNVLGLPAFEEGFEDVLTKALEGESETANEKAAGFLRRLGELPVLAPLFR